MRKLLLLALVALPLLAADLGRYSGWASSPAAYSMTFDERARWAALRTEAEAEAFVQQYLASRGGETFTAGLNKRVRMADQHFTLGAQRGSRTTRGKIVILLGPPQAMEVSGDGPVRIYTFRYPNLTVPVEVNTATGKDRIRDRKANAKLERAFEAAAKASIVVR